MDTSINPLPSLSTKGYIYDLQDRCDRLMSYFLASQASESYLYSGNVTSLQLLIQKYGGDPQQFCLHLKSALMTYFNGYFPAGAVVDTRNDSDDGTNLTNNYNVWMSVQITENGKNYSLNEQILKKDSSFERVIQAANYGIYS